MKKFLNLEFLNAVLSTLIGITYLFGGTALVDYILGALWLSIGGTDWWTWYYKNWWRCRWIRTAI